MANTAKQMEVFGYTPEGLDQEVEKYAGEAKEDFAENKLEEERRANHPLNDVPFFQRPINASTDDIELYRRDDGARGFKDKFGGIYFISENPDQRTEREKLREGIINSLEGIKDYLKDPSLPSKEQVVDFVKSAAVGTLEDIDRMMKGGATYGDIFGYTAGVGAASTPFKVPSGPDSTTLRVFGGPGAPDYKNEAYYKALQLKGRGYTDKQIEEITGRFRTARSGDYIPQVNQRLDTLYYNKDFLNSRTKTVNNKDIIEKELKAIEAEIAQLEKKYPGGVVDPKAESIFKFEIPDDNIKIKTNNGVINYKEATVDSPILVGDLIPTHTKLFKQYPDLKNLEFYVDPDSTGAYFDPFGGKLLDDGTGRRTGAIAIGSDIEGFDNVNSQNFRYVFFHELQHAVQHQDYLIADLEQLGGNPTSYLKSIANKDSTGSSFQQAAILKNPKALKIKDEIIALFKKEYPTKFKWVEEDFSVTDEGLKSINPKVAKKLAKLMRDLELESHRTYLQTASEIEATVVGLRASGAKGSITPQISTRRKVGTLEEYFKEDKQGNKIPQADSQVTKIIKNIKSRFKPMDKFEQMRYHGAAVYFARYALGMDAELQKFDLTGVEGTINSPSSIKPTNIKSTKATLEDYGYYQDNPATKGREGGEDWVKKQQRYAEEDAARGGSGATKKFFNGPITANLGGMDNNKPLFLDSKFLASLKGANDEVRDASDSKYKELLKDAQDGGFDPDQKGNKVVVGVNHKGEAYIIEGNTRAAVASELGIPSVKVEVRYWNGAETVDGPYSPQNILKYANKEPKNFAEGGYTVRPEPRPRTKTDEKTLRGRSVWIDETGEITGEKGTKYSEVSTTIPFGTGWITAPTIDENGNRLSDVEVKQKLKDSHGKDFITGEKLPVFSTEEKASEYAQWRSDTMFDKEAIEEGFPEETFSDLPDDTIKQKEEKDSFLDYLLSPSKHGVFFKKPKYNKGGTVMNEQMQMAFMMDEGGLTDDGMNTDPVSGNEVPSGSMAEEVRDNIPAQLSEGEYVVPADVVRYYGVKFFEDLRDEAKRGLADMEANGRIGGEPVPAGGPMNTEELSPEEMQAIQEMMGMAEGGDVQNPYMQQQLLYSQPRPAPIDDQKNTVVGITNPAQNQMPVQNMSSGGQVQGYQNSSVVTNPNTPTSLNQGLEQNFLQQGQQAVNRGFVGFPLGSTIFPSEKTGQTALGPVGTQVATTGAIDTAIAGTAGTDTSMLTTVTLYGPNGDVIVLTLPTDQARYDELIAQGYSTTPPVAGEPVVKGGGDDGGDDDKVKRDPNAWMEKFDYNDPKSLLQQTSQSLTKNPFGGVIGIFDNGQKAAKAAANIIIAKALGEETAEAEAQLERFKKETFLDKLPPELINGDKLARDIAETQFINLDRNITDLGGNSIFKDDDDYQSHVVQMRQNTTANVKQAAKDTVMVGKDKSRVYKPGGIDVALLKKDDKSKAAQAARKKSKKKSAASKAAMERAQSKLKKDGATIRHVIDGKKAEYGTKTAAGVKALKKAYEKEGGTWASGGRNKGGLMTKGKNK